MSAWRQDPNKNPHTRGMLGFLLEHGGALLASRSPRIRVVRGACTEKVQHIRLSAVGAAHACCPFSILIRSEYETKPQARRAESLVLLA